MKKAALFLVLTSLILSLCLPALAEVPEEVIYIYGGSSNPNRAKLKNMGQQSWYMMYSTQTNAGEAIDLSTFKECMQTETGLWKPAEEVVLKSFAPGHEEDDVTYHGEWFNIRKDGFLAGDTGFSAALKWVCEYDGTYDLYLSYSGGTSAGGPEEPYYQENGVYIPAVDGVYMSFFIQDEMIFCVDSYPLPGHRIEQTETEFNEVELKAGDTIWMVADTKVNGGWDDPWWCLRIKRVGD